MSIKLCIKKCPLGDTFSLGAPFLLYNLLVPITQFFIFAHKGHRRSHILYVHYMLVWATADMWLQFYRGVVSPHTIPTD